MAAMMCGRVVQNDHAKSGGTITHLHLQKGMFTEVRYLTCRDTLTFVGNFLAGDMFTASLKRAENYSQN